MDKILSQYELVTTRPHLTPKIQLIKVEVKNRKTNEVLGEFIRYSVYGGWADMLFYGLTGFSYSPSICIGKYKRQIYPSDLVKATLKPIHKLN